MKERRMKEEDTLAIAFKTQRIISMTRENPTLKIYLAEEVRKKIEKLRMKEKRRDTMCMKILRKFYLCKSYNAQDTRKILH